MAITLNGTTGITTPDIDSTAGFDAADITGTISQSQLSGEAVNESKLQVSNAPTNGYMLTAQSGDTGGLTWADAPTSSTTYGDVGTYVTAMRSVQSTSFAGGTTVAASTLVKFDDSGSGNATFPLKSDSTNTSDSSSTGLSGTWRLMAPLQKSNATARNIGGLYLRIS